MSDHLRQSRDDLYAMLAALEEAMLDQVREFERATGMAVRAIKLYPGAMEHGRPLTRAIEVAAQLR